MRSIVKTMLLVKEILVVLSLYNITLTDKNILSLIYFRQTQILKFIFAIITLQTLRSFLNTFSCLYFENY